MAGKRGKKSPKKAQPTETFQQMMAGQTLKKFQGFIEQEIAVRTQSLTKHIIELNEQVIAMQEVLIEEVPEFSAEKLEDMIITVVDRKYGLVKAGDRPVQKGDSLRVTIKTKLKDDEDFSEHSSPMLVHQIGSGQTLKEVEEGMYGMKVGDTKDIPNENGEATFRITVDRISEPKVKPEAPSAD